jgi:hypothetical protein
MIRATEEVIASMTVVRLLPETLAAVEALRQRKEMIASSYYKY